MQERSLPGSPEAERGLLGLLLWHNSTLTDVAPLLDADDFCGEDRRAIYVAMLAQAERREAYDALAISEALLRRGITDLEGRDAYVYLDALTDREMNLISFDPPGIRAETYAKAIAQYAESRRLVDAIQHIAPLAYNSTENAVEQAEALIMAVRRRRSRQDFTSIGDYMPTYLNRLEGLQADKQIRGIPTGFADLDKVISFERGNLYIPAARPGVGKSALIQNFAYNAARKYGKHSALFSLEMNFDDVMDRFISIHTKLDSQLLRNGEVADDDWKLLVGDTMDTFEHLGIYINHTPGITIDTLKSMARREVGRHTIDILFVDYLQLLKAEIGGKRITPRAEEVAEIARQLKELAGELNVPIVAPAQINREIDRRAGSKVEGEDYTYKIPMLADLRESGELEQSADVVIFLARAEEKEEYVKLDVAKHRMGPIGQLDLYFVGSETRFYSLDETAVNA